MRDHEPNGASRVQRDEKPDDVRGLLERHDGLTGDAGTSDGGRGHAVVGEANAREEYRRRGKALVDTGDLLRAHELLSAGLRVVPKDVRLRQLLALTLAEQGENEQAFQMLFSLHRDVGEDEETLGLLARLYQDRALQAKGKGARQRELRRAYTYYLRIYRRWQSSSNGINAATLLMLLGRRPEAKALARDIGRLCQERLAQDRSGRADHYWEMAALGAAALILGEDATARRWYTRAVEIGRGRYRDIQTTRRQARLLATELQRPGAMDVVEECLRRPPVLVFAGHMIDLPGRPVPRFPEGLENDVKEALRRHVRMRPAPIAFSSIACGSDILFLEAVLEAGGEVRIVVPYRLEDFVRDSVDVVPTSRWRERCERLVDAAQEVVVASQYPLHSGGMSYRYASLLLLGLATLRANELDGVVSPLAVWNGQPGDGAGGTAHIVEEWRRLGYTVRVIGLDAMLAQKSRSRRRPATVTRTLAGAPRLASRPLGAEIMAILFADFVRFSDLSEENMPEFIEHVLGCFGERIAASRHRPIVNESRGDGYYLVFSTVKDAGLFALDLADHVAQLEWCRRRMPAGEVFRFGLHAGPVFSFTDPVTRLRTYTGTHVVQAARIEPITPPGQVYASQAFAAFAAVERVSDFRCQYVGVLPLHKGYGVAPVYRVQRSPGSPGDGRKDRPARPLVQSIG
jgi:class 3 adenylate cyclase/tetratricopeptide (TPR) repeat protein